MQRTGPHTCAPRARPPHDAERRGVRAVVARHAAGVALRAVGHVVGEQDIGEAHAAREGVLDGQPEGALRVRAMRDGDG